MAEGSKLGTLMKFMGGGLGLVAAFLALLDRVPTRIETFHSNLYSVSKGDHITLTWRVKGLGNQVLLDGQPVPSEDARDFVIDGPHTFVLIARGSWGEDRKPIAINLGPRNQEQTKRNLVSGAAGTTDPVGQQTPNPGAAQADTEMEALADKAQQAFDAKDYKGAFDTCSRAMKAFGESQECETIREHAGIKLAEQLVNQAQAHFERAEFDEAFWSAEKALLMDPRNQAATKLKKLATEMKAHSP